MFRVIPKHISTDDKRPANGCSPEIPALGQGSLKNLFSVSRRSYKRERGLRSRQRFADALRESCENDGRSQTL
jgi:hypothetical protein